MQGHSLLRVSLAALTIGLFTAPTVFSQFYLCVDAGHGYGNPGDSLRDHGSNTCLSSSDAWYEADINLMVVLALKDTLEAEGFPQYIDVIYTRLIDVGLLRTTRARIAMEFRAQSFISVHHNSTADRNFATGGPAIE